MNQSLLISPFITCLIASLRFLSPAIHKLRSTPSLCSHDITRVLRICLFSLFRAPTQIWKSTESHVRASSAHRVEYTQYCLSVSNFNNFWMHKGFIESYAHSIRFSFNDKHDCLRCQSDIMYTHRARAVAIQCKFIDCSWHFRDVRHRVRLFSKQLMTLCWVIVWITLACCLYAPSTKKRHASEYEQLTTS